jgi:hypothetical protein
MKKAVFVILLLGLFHASGSPDTPSLYIIQYNPIIKPPDKAETQFKLFIQHLGLIESANQWQVINSIGCMGKYQFATATLEFLGYHGITPEKFKANPNIFPPALQELALIDLIRHNENSLKKFNQYIGQVINGILITKAGLLGAAHLAGVRGVQRYLTGNHNAVDMNGSSIQTYLIEFQNYII